MKIKTQKTTQLILLLLMLSFITACGPAAEASVPAANPTTPADNPPSTAVAGPTPPVSSPPAQPAGTPSPTPTTSPQPTASPTVAANPYADFARSILAEVESHCVQTGPNQACLVHGPVEVAAMEGAQPLAFAQPGDVIDLAQVQGLKLGAANLDNSSWGVALLKLQPYPESPELILSILALGDTHLTDLVVNPPDEAEIPLTFVSGPDDSAEELPLAPPAETLQSFNFVSGQTTDPALLPSGLLLYTPPGEDFVSLRINGAEIIIGSTALVQAQPNQPMTVAMKEGQAMVATQTGADVAVAGQQINVPLNQNGQADGAPSQTESSGPGVMDDLLTPLAPPSKPEPKPGKDTLIPLNGKDLSPRSWRIEVLMSFQHAHDRCMAGNSRYLYHELYWLRQLELHPEAIQGTDYLEVAHRVIKKCATFELDFGSTTQTVLKGFYFNSRVLAKGVKITFNPNGSIETKAQPLKYVSYESNVTMPPCSRHVSSKDGTLQITDGSIKIKGNGLQIGLNMAYDPPEDLITFTCPRLGEAPAKFSNQWNSAFGILYRDLRAADLTYRISDWKFAGTELFAEAIYDRAETVEDADLSSTSYWVLVHTPQKTQKKK